MENNENEVQNQQNSSASVEEGYTKAPTPDYSQAPVYTASQATQQGQGLAIAGMVLGILSLVCCCISPFNVVFSIIGLILSIVSLVQKKPGKGMAIAGLVCSIISLIPAVLVVIGSFSLASML